MGFRIEEMYAFVAVAPDGDEGIMGIRSPSGEWMPLVGADLKRIEILRPRVQEVADITGCAVRLVRFTTRSELGVITPKSKN